MRSISGFALTVNHYYGHSVHILSMEMFVPFHSFILMMPQPPTPRHRRTRTQATRLWSTMFWKIYINPYGKAIKEMARDIHEIAM